MLPILDCSGQKDGKQTPSFLFPSSPESPTCVSQGATGSQRARDPADKFHESEPLGPVPAGEEGKRLL
jgi:hypothetical protein